MGDNYAKTLFAYRSVGPPSEEKKCKSFLTYKSAIYKNSQNDNEFYSSLVKLLTATLLDCFERNETQIVEKEIERLFRTNVFNSSERSQERAAYER